MNGHTNIKEVNILYCRNPAWPMVKVITTSIHVRWRGWNGEEYVVGELCQLKGDGTKNFPHCIILSYCCWLCSFFMLLLSVLAVIL